LNETTFGDMLGDCHGHMGHGIVSLAVAFKPCVGDDNTFEHHRAVHQDDASRPIGVGEIMQCLER